MNEQMLRRPQVAPDNKCGHEYGPWTCERRPDHKGKHGCGTRPNRESKPMALAACLVRWRGRNDD